MPRGLTRYNEVVNAAAEKFGKPLDVGQAHKARMSAAGFVDVQEAIFRVPIGPWPQDQKQKQVGHCQLANILMALESYGLGLFTQVMGMTPEEAHALIEVCRGEARDAKNQIYADLYWVSGTKPKDGEGEASPA